MNTQQIQKLKIIGNNIYQARTMQGLTMQDVADKTGLCRQTVSDAEKGSPSLQIGVVLKIMDAVGVDLSGDIQPQLFKRTVKQTGALNNCEGITKDGTKFIIKRRRHRYCAIFQHDGVTCVTPIPASALENAKNGWEKFLYLFHAESYVMKAKAKITVDKIVRELEK